MRLLLIGAPGSGKGTQAKALAAHYGVAHIASGDLLRAQMRDGTPLGEKVRSYVEAGDLVPDELILELLPPVMEAASEAGGYILDGFPRNLEQGEALYRLARQRGVTVRAAIYLRAEPAELLERLLGRAREEGRSDDREATIRHRIEVFTGTTAPLVDFYAGRGILVDVDAMAPVTRVTTAILDGITALGEPTVPAAALDAASPPAAG